ncbi:MFS transporter [Cryptosporangium phraense]|uniref:MFS transporter n=1 Tax=Cryptosporangium phraense TaxID=2593070 RepID=A0A545AUJ9_9ACTN|nr:MFS transporter [Cryptosporangium phraense]TQS45007.1 MFS transporter [Cryptosporangium phraense]
MTVGIRSALDEPTRSPGGRWLTSWTLGHFAFFMVMFAAAQVVLPRQAESISPDHKETVVSVVTLVAALVTIVVNVLVGAYSDRTLARRGRRQIWVFIGALVTIVGLVFQGYQHTVAGMVVIWALVQVGLSSISAALTAALPDEVPVASRARASSLWGIASAAGPLIGIALVSTVFLGVPSAYLALAVLTVFLAFPFALGTRGVPLLPTERPAASLGAVLRGTLAPLRFPDFAWAWTGRFFIQLSNALAQVYLWFFLRDRVGVDPDLWTLYLALLYTAGAVGAAIPAGRISDRTGRRKMLVVVSSVLQGIAAVFYMLWPDTWAAIVGSLLLGIGFGCYAAVDQALITQVLPRAEDRGKDLGVINIANNLPYVFAGALGGATLALFGRDDLGYPVLYALSLVTAVIAALTVQPIKSVR